MVLFIVEFNLLEASCMYIDKLFIVFLTRLACIARIKANLFRVDKIPILILIIIVCVQTLFAKITEIIRLNMRLGTLISNHFI